MKKVLALLLASLMACSSISVISASADAGAAILDTYEWVNVATKANIYCDDGYSFTVNDGKNLVDIDNSALPTYTVVPIGSGLVFDVGKEYNITKIRVTNEYRDSSYILQGSNDGVSFAEITDFSFADAELLCNVYYKQEKEFTNTKAYRYYRIVTAETQAPHNMCFCDVQLLTKYNVQPANWERERVISSLSADDAVTANDEYTVTGKIQLSDDDISGSYCQANSGAEYIKYDLGQAYTVTELSCIYRGQSRRFEIYASKDDVNYELIYAATTGGAYDNPDNTGSIYLDAPEYRYIKFVRPNKDALIGIRELYLYTTKPTEEYWAQLDDNEYWFDASVGASVSNDANSWVNPANYSVDRIETTAAIAKATYITYDLGNLFELGGYEIDYEYRADTTSLTLYGSEDNTNWTKLYEIPKGTDRTRYTQSGNFEHNNYRYVKLQADMDGGVFYIYELVLKGIARQGKNENIAAGKETNEAKTGVTDGNTEHKSAIAAGQDYTLYLGTDVDVKGIRIVYSDRRGHYTVFGSENGTDYIALTTYDGSSESVDTAVSKDTGIVSVKPGNWKYIKITNKDQNVVNLYELEVYASRVSGVTKSEILDNVWTFEYENNTQTPFSFVAIRAIYDENSLVNVVITEERAEAYEILTKSYQTSAGEKGFLWKTISQIDSIAKPAV